MFAYVAQLGSSRCEHLLSCYTLDTFILHRKIWPSTLMYLVMIFFGPVLFRNCNPSQKTTKHTHKQVQSKNKLRTKRYVTYVHPVQQIEGS